MSRFKFEMPTEDEARAFLAWRRCEHMYQAELYHDALACVRRLRPVTSPAELQANREFLKFLNTQRDGGR